jgi:hypothetical protein
MPKLSKSTNHFAAFTRKGAKLWFRREKDRLADFNRRFWGRLAAP